MTADETIELVAAQIRERAATIHALGMFGDHQGSAQVADKLIADLVRRDPNQMLHVIGLLAHHDPQVLAQVAVWVVDVDARDDADRLVLAAENDLHGTETEPSPIAPDPRRRRRSL